MTLRLDQYAIAALCGLALAACASRSLDQTPPGRAIGQVDAAPDGAARPSQAAARGAERGSPDAMPSCADVARAAARATPGPARAHAADFDALAPILHRCQPCHFPGGKMYERMPFDDAATIRRLGTALFSRIQSEQDRAALQAFFDAS